MAQFVKMSRCLAGVLLCLPSIIKTNRMKKLKLSFKNEHVMRTLSFTVPCFFAKLQRGSVVQKT